MREVRTWSKVTTEELRAYSGFSVMMGVVDLLSFDDYWRKEALYPFSQLQKGFPVIILGRTPATSILSQHHSKPSLGPVL